MPLYSSLERNRYTLVAANTFAVDFIATKLVWAVTVGASVLITIVAATLLLGT